MSIRNLLALLPLTIIAGACGGAAMPEPPATPDPSAAAAEAKPVKRKATAKNTTAPAAKLSDWLQDQKGSGRNN